MRKPFWLLEEIDKFFLYFFLGQLIGFFLFDIRIIHPFVSLFAVVATCGLLSVVYAARSQVTKKDK